MSPQNRQAIATLLFVALLLSNKLRAAVIAKRKRENFEQLQRGIARLNEIRDRRGQQWPSWN
jgi:ribose 1,5-bisphosphokinase PhnN